MTEAEIRREDAARKKKENETCFDFIRPEVMKDKDGNRPDHPDYDPRTVYIPRKSFDSMSPFEKQFWEIKQNHFDTVLFFQKGKFFELYEEDARIGHREFDLKLTERVKMCMVSVPFTPSSPINLTRSGCLSRASSCGLPSSSVQGIKSERWNKLRLPSGASWLALTR